MHEFQFIVRFYHDEDDPFNFTQETFTVTASDSDEAHSKLDDLIEEEIETYYGEVYEVETKLENVC